MYVYITKKNVFKNFFPLNVLAKQEGFIEVNKKRDLVLFFPCDRRDFTKK